jgi:hypothetical protein
MKKFLLTALVAATLASSGLAQAHGSGASEASLALSMLPVAVSVVAPVMVLSAGAAFTVVAVHAASEGTVWVLERTSDGARMSVTLSGDVAAGASHLVGAAVLTTAISTGWLLTTAGKVVCFIPNEVGKALMYNERVTR